MNQSILDGLTVRYTLVKVGNSNTWIQKSLDLVAHELKVLGLKLPLQVRAAKV